MRVHVCEHPLHTNTAVMRGYRGASLIKSSPPVGPYSRTMPRALRWS